MYNRGKPEQAPQVYKQEGHICIIGANLSKPHRSMNKKFTYV